MSPHLLGSKPNPFFPLFFTGCLPLCPLCICHLYSVSLCLLHSPTLSSPHPYPWLKDEELLPNWPPHRPLLAASLLSTLCPMVALKMQIWLSSSLACRLSVACCDFGSKFLLWGTGSKVTSPSATLLFPRPQSRAIPPLGHSGPSTSHDALSPPQSTEFACGFLWLLFSVRHNLVNSYIAFMSQLTYHFFREFFLYSKTREVPYEELLERSCFFIALSTVM